MGRWIVLAAAALVVAGSTGEASGATYAWIPDGSGDTVRRLDLATNESAPVTVGQAPYGVATSADGGIAVVANSGSASASIIDAATATVLDTVTVGPGPRGVGVTPDGAKAYVASFSDQSISVVDVAAGTVIETIPLDGFPNAVVMSPSGHRAYVTKASFAGTLLVIDTATDQAVTDVVVSFFEATAGLTVDPTGSRVYVGLYSSVAIVDAATNLLLDEVPLTCGGCTSLQDLAITPDGAKLYGSLEFGDGVVAVDLATEEATPIPSSGFNSSSVGVEVSPDGATLYVLNSSLGTIDLVDVATDTIRATLVALVDLPRTTGDFIGGPTTPPEPPLLDAAEQACQKALLDSFKSFGAKAHQLLGGCLLRVAKDRATAGSATGATVTACTRDVGPANAASRLAKARLLARYRVLTKCGALEPDALGVACGAGAPSAGAVVDCVLDRQLEHVAQLLGDEVAAPCVLLADVGAEGALGGTCD